MEDQNHQEDSLLTNTTNIVSPPSSSPHVVMFPLPIQGPINCMLKLADLLLTLTQDQPTISITFLTTDFVHHRLTRYSTTAARLARSGPNFRFETVPDLIGPDDDPRVSRKLGDVVTFLEDQAKTKGSRLREVLAYGSAEAGFRKAVTCVVAEAFYGCMVDVAEELNVPLVYFETISPSGLWTFLRMPNMLQSRELPFQALCILFFLPSKSLAHRPPGPKGLPIIGNLHQFDPLKTHVYFSELSKKYGPLVYLKLGFVPTIVVSSPTLAKEVLKTQDHVFCSRPAFVSQQKLTYNGLDLVVSPYSEYWKEMRKICVTHLFSSKRVQSFSWVRHEEVCRTIRVVSTLSSESNPVDLSGLLMSFSNSVICRIGFSKIYNDDVKSRFQDLLHETQATLSAFFLSDYFPYTGWVDKISGASCKLERVFAVLDEFYQELIEEHLESYQQKSEQEQDIIDVLLQLRNEHNLPFELTLDHIKAILLDILVAGTDTGAAVMVWAMTELMKNPNVMRKVQEEVRNMVKEQGSSSTMIQEEQLHHLTYLKAAVKEAFRIHAPAPLLIPRQTMQNCTLGGYQIERGTLVFINAWAIGRDPNSWESPETFMPERFLGSPIDYKGQDFELIPFGAGRRGCPGMLMGAATIELALANLLCFFDWELPADMKREDIDMDTAPGITVHKKAALCLIATKFLND